MKNSNVAAGLAGAGLMLFVGLAVTFLTASFLQDRAQVRPVAVAGTSDNVVPMRAVAAAPRLPVGPDAQEDWPTAERLLPQIHAKR